MSVTDDLQPSSKSGGPPAVGERSQQAYRRARAVFPDGTTRISIERDPLPRYVSRGDGAYLWDLDDRRFLDLNNNYTTLIHGHAYAPVAETLTRQLADGSCFANPTESEIALAGLLCERIPHIDRVRFMNSGTEAVMFAIKAARAYSGRPAIAKIEGAFHGSYDWAEVGQASTPDNWGSAQQPASTAFYRGMPQSVLDDVVILPLNAIDIARKLLRQHAGRLAALLLDPMPSRAGLIALDPDYIAAISEICNACGILIISDEVLNLRQSYRGAAHRYGLKADLFSLGKIIGGGLPIGAVGGREEVMTVFDGSRGRPALPQGGTFSANPLSMAAGYAAMAALDDAAFAHLESLGDHIRDGLSAAIERHDAPFSVTGAASLLRLHPRRSAPRNFREAFLTPAGKAAMTALSRFYGHHGVLLPRETCASLSTPMTVTDARHVVAVFDAFLAEQRELFPTLERDGAAP
ncbi:MAG: aminotransferase class III-fold pyridoxal phosphate-dependent enzyme [Alphaproteobacteria bacterium]